VGIPYNYVIDSAMHEPDYAGMYTIAVTNTGTAPLRIHSICVTDGAPNPARNTCYFYNATFDFGEAGWTLSEDAQAWDGDLRIPDGETFAQNVHLWPGTMNYNLEVYASLWTARDYEPAEEDVVNYVKMEYQWGVGDWTPIYTSLPGPIYNDRAFFGDFAVHPKIRFYESLPVSTETNGAFTFRPTFYEGIPAEVYGLTIWDVCLSYPGGDFPGDEGDSGWDPPLDPVCQYISPPVGNNLGQWISYLWARLNRFFECELMVNLNAIWNLLMQFKDMVGWAIRYINAVIWYTSNWLGTDLLPWLGGHFYNMAMGQTTYINAGEGQCNNIFCFFSNLFGTGGSIFDTLINGLTSLFHDLTTSIDNLVSNLASILSQIIAQIIAPIVDTLLGILNQAVGVLLTIILAVIQAAFMLIGLAYSVFEHMIHLADVIIGAWQNATPTPIPGLPTCAIDPKSNAFCAGLWMLENTVFSGPGQLLIPILIGYGTIMMILWGIGEFKKMLAEVGGSL
jgi:hypothetical protein